MPPRKKTRSSGETMWTWIQDHKLLLFLLLVGILVRTYHFGAIPPGLNQDEASTGYDAWAVLKYGIDRNGFHFPVMFVAWGSGMYALSGYLAWPFMVFFGLSEVTVRLPHLVMGCIALMVFYHLLKNISDRSTALIGLFLLVINPWHIMVSRWGLDSNLFPACFLLGVFTLTHALTKKRYAILPLAAGLFALCLYFYGTAYVVIPVFLFLTGILLFFRHRIPWNISMRSGIAFAIIALPIVLYVVINQFHLTSLELPFLSIPRLSGVPRFQTVSSLFSSNFFHHLLENGKNLWNLLLHQDDGLAGNRVPGFGMLYPPGILFAFLGLIVCLQRSVRTKGKDPSVSMLLWFLSAVTVGLLQSVNINRINIIVFPLIFFMTMGIRFFWEKNRTIFFSVIGLFSLYFLFFVHAYFTWYPIDVKDAFFSGLREAIASASEHTTEKICVTERVNQPYIFVLFEEKIDPHVFLNTAEIINPGAEFQGVRRFGRYTFGLDSCHDATYGAYVLHRDERDIFPSQDYHREDFDVYSVAIPLHKS